MEVEAVDEVRSPKVLVPEGTGAIKVKGYTRIAILAADGEDVSKAAAGAGRAIGSGSRRRARARRCAGG